MATPAQATSIPSKEELIAKLKEGSAVWNAWWQTLTVEDRKRIDLSGANLASAKLKSVDLSNANLSNCDLSKASLQGATFSDAILRGTQLTGATLIKANFTNALLKGANLNSANLKICDLRGANLRGADLTNAVLIDAQVGEGTLAAEATLVGANLLNTNFHNAELRHAKFGGANLRLADLSGADLQGADLSDPKGGLLPKQLAGADLTGATLPAPLAKLYDKMGAVTKISKSARKVFTGLLVGCLYCWLTIGTTKDIDLITDRPSSQLPIIQSAIPIVAFYVAAPIILLCIYFYFHFYLQKLWEELAQLPAIFTDGKPLDQRADPWLFNDLVRAHVAKLRGDRPFLSHLQKAISILLAWGLVPITLLLFWGRYLRRHDHVWTYVLAAIVGTSIFAGFRFYLLARHTLRRKQRSSVKESLRQPRLYVTTAIVVSSLMVPIVLSNWAINGTDQFRLAKVMAWFHCPLFANLTDTDASFKPPNYDGTLKLVKGADINGQDLRYADAHGAFFAKSQIKSSHIWGANLSYADLRLADLTQTDLTGADIEFADLQGAIGLTAKSLSSCKHYNLAFLDRELLLALHLPPDNNYPVEAYKNSGLREDFQSWQVKWNKHLQDEFTKSRAKDFQSWEVEWLRNNPKELQAPDLK